MSNSYKATDALHLDKVIYSVARSAVAHDKVIETTEVDFRVDVGGNVVLVEMANPAQIVWQPRKGAGTRQEMLVVIPREEAFARIAAATWEKVEQLRQIYEQTQKKAGAWSGCSYASVIITIICIICASIFALLLGMTKMYMSEFAISVLLSIGGMLIVSYIVRRAQRCDKQANDDLDKFMQIENFYKTITTIGELASDDVTRGVLQEIIITRALGLSNQQNRAQQNGNLH